MPYDRLAELPPGVRRNLPEHGQEIYRKAFNHAWREYEAPHRRRPGATAVYEKSAQGTWRRRRRRGAGRTDSTPGRKM